MSHVKDAAVLSTTPTFLFDDGHFLVQISNRHQHRRATIQELEETLLPGVNHDHPAHWFEAQLIHYGLRPTKYTSMARMRLRDALNSGALAVPVHLSSMEAQLREEWVPRREQAEATPDVAEESATDLMAAGIKREAIGDPELDIPRDIKKAKPSPNESVDEKKLVSSTDSYTKTRPPKTSSKSNRRHRTLVEIPPFAQSMPVTQSPPEMVSPPRTARPPVTARPPKTARPPVTVRPPVRESPWEFTTEAWASGSH